MMWPRPRTAGSPLISPARRSNDMAAGSGLYRGWRWLLLGGLALVALAGCKSFDRDADKKPAKLTSFEVERKLKRVWSRGVGIGHGGLYHRRVPAVEGELILQAAINRQSSSHQ